MSRSRISRGFGMAGESPEESIHIAARAAEAAGFDTFWLSQPKSGSTLRMLEFLGDLTSDIRLGVGAIPFTKQSPENIDSEVRQRSLPHDRIRLGVGSGTGSGSLERLRTGVGRLRALLDVEIVVAPLGPKMCELAGEVADTVLLNWLTPEHARTSLDWVSIGAEKAGRQRPTVATYVRCAIGHGSMARLEAECARYGAFPHYAAHFKRQNVRPIDTTLHSTDVSEIRFGLERLESILDEVVVRAITPHDSTDEILYLVEQTKP